MIRGRKEYIASFASKLEEDWKTKMFTTKETSWDCAMKRMDQKGFTAVKGGNSSVLAD